MNNYIKYLDFLHTPNNFPITKSSSKSYFGIFLSIAFLIYYLVYLSIKIFSYKKNFTISFSRDLINYNEVNQQKITFGFRISENWNDEIIIKMLNSNNEFLDYSKRKFCYENLTEIKDNIIYNNNFTCFIDYSINTSNYTNHFLKLHLIYKGNKYHGITERVPLLIRFKEAIINHEKDNPFIYPDLFELTYFYELNYTTGYRKYVRTLSYKTEKLLAEDVKTTAYLEDFEDSSKSDQIDNKGYDGAYIGSFRFAISKKKDKYVRKYVNIFDFMSMIGGHFTTVKGFFALLSLIFVNMNDNLRLFNSFLENNPSMAKPASDAINHFWKKNQKNKKTPKYELKINEIKNNDKIWYSLRYFLCCFCCCKTYKQNKNIYLNKCEAIDEFMNTLKIDNYLKYKIIQEKKIQKISDILEEIKKSPDFINQNEEESQKYLEKKFFENGNYNEIEKEEYKILISLVIEEDKRKIKVQDNMFMDDDTNSLENIIIQETSEELIPKIVINNNI